VKTIAIANQKGGVGKTTTAVNLGHGLALRGRQVLVADCDPQGQVATFLGLRQESGLFDLLAGGRSLSDVVRSADTPDHCRPFLRILPGDRRTAAAQAVLLLGGAHEGVLQDALSAIHVDYILLDTSPSVSLLQSAAIYAADYLLVPVAVDYAALEGLGRLLSSLSDFRKAGGHCQLLCVLPTFYDRWTKESQRSMRQLRYQFGEAAWEPISRATILRECAAMGLTVFEYAPSSRAAEEYRELTAAVLATAKEVEDGGA